MDKRITRYLKTSFIVVAIICIGLFVFMGIYLNEEIARTTNDVSHLYMEEIQSQLQQKFHTILELRAMQLDAVIEEAEKAEKLTGEIFVKFSNSAMTRDFVAAGLYRSDGTIDMLYGETIRIEGNLTVNCMCEKQNHMIQLGYTSDDEKVLILGRIESLEMEDGGTSDVLFAVLPFEYLNYAMCLDDPATQVYSHIIDSKGEFIISNGKTKQYDNIYDHISNDYEGINGKDVQNYAEEVSYALSHNEEYSSINVVDGDVRVIYISRLTDALDWYVMTVMPDKDIDDLLNGLYTTRYLVMFGSSTPYLLS